MGEIVGFILGSGQGSRRPLTVFFPAKDFDETGERLSLIRGKNGTRSGFDPDDRLPPVYEPFSVDVLGNRIPGKWAKLAVLAPTGDEGSQVMLKHTAVQARMRSLM